jgi:hypothetical protein
VTPSTTTSGANGSTDKGGRAEISPLRLTANESDHPGQRINPVGAIDPELSSLKCAKIAIFARL